MKTFCVSVIFLTIAIYYTDGLVCEKVTCPADALMCDVKYVNTFNPNKRSTKVVCFNQYRESNTLKKIIKKIIEK